MNRRFCVTVVFLFSLLAVVFAEGNTFSWQLAIEKLTDEDPILLDSTKPLELQNDDLFTVSMKSNANAYCYILLENSDGSVSLLSNTKLIAKKGIVLPSNDGTAFSITPPSGTDKLHICVSSEKQKDLEAAIKQLSTKKAGTTAYTKATQKVLSQIDKLKLQTTQLAETAAKPATVGAVTRNVKTTTIDLSEQDAETTDTAIQPAEDVIPEPTPATPEQLSGQSLYVKTIRITH